MRYTLLAALILAGLLCWRTVVAHETNTAHEEPVPVSDTADTPVNDNRAATASVARDGNQNETLEVASVDEKKSAQYNVPVIGTGVLMLLGGVWLGLKKRKTRPSGPSSAG